jgi:hypothetical protein
MNKSQNVGEEFWAAKSRNKVIRGLLRVYSSVLYRFCSQHLAPLVRIVASPQVADQVAD